MKRSFMKCSLPNGQWVNTVDRTVEFQDIKPSGISRLPWDKVDDTCMKMVGRTILFGDAGTYKLFLSIKHSSDSAEFSVLLNGVELIGVSSYNGRTFGSSEFFCEALSSVSVVYKGDNNVFLKEGSYITVVKSIDDIPKKEVKPVANITNIDNLTWGTVTNAGDGGDVVINGGSGWTTTGNCGNLAITGNLSWDDSLHIDFDTLSEDSVRQLRDKLIKSGNALKLNKDTGKFELDMSKVDTTLLHQIKDIMIKTLTDGEIADLAKTLIGPDSGLKLEGGRLSVDLDYIKRKVDDDCIVIPEMLDCYDFSNGYRGGISEGNASLYSDGRRQTRDNELRRRAKAPKKRKRVATKPVAKSDKQVDAELWSFFDSIEALKSRGGHYVLENLPEDMAKFLCVSESDIVVRFEDVIKSAERWGKNQSSVFKNRKYKVLDVVGLKVIRRNRFMFDGSI